MCGRVLSSAGNVVGSGRRRFSKKTLEEVLVNLFNYADSTIYRFCTLCFLYTRCEEVFRDDGTTSSEESEGVSSVLDGGSNEGIFASRFSSR